METVMLEETDAGAEIQAAKLAAEDADGMIVDQEYRLTLLELGLTDETWVMNGRWKGCCIGLWSAWSSAARLRAWKPSWMCSTLRAKSPRLSIPSWSGCWPPRRRKQWSTRGTSPGSGPVLRAFLAGWTFPVERSWKLTMAFWCGRGSSCVASPRRTPMTTSVRTMTARAGGAGNWWPPSLPACGPEMSVTPVTWLAGIRCGRMPSAGNIAGRSTKITGSGITNSIMRRWWTCCKLLPWWGRWSNDSKPMGGRETVLPKFIFGGMCKWKWQSVRICSSSWPRCWPPWGWSVALPYGATGLYCGTRSRTRLSRQSATNRPLSAMGCLPASRVLRRKGATAL